MILKAREQDKKTLGWEGKMELLFSYRDKIASIRRDPIITEFNLQHFTDEEIESQKGKVTYQSDST